MEQSVHTVDSTRLDRLITNHVESAHLIDNYQVQKIYGPYVKGKISSFHRFCQNVHGNSKNPNSVPVGGEPVIYLHSAYFVDLRLTFSKQFS